MPVTVRCRVLVAVGVTLAGCPQPPVTPPGEADGGPATATEDPAVVTCRALIAPDEPLEEAALLAVRPGDPVADPDAHAWGEGWERAGEILHERAGEAHVLLVPLAWPGNGAALAILRETPTGSCVINAWAFAFGGNGIDFESIAPAAATDGALEIDLDLVGHCRGFYENPDDESSYVPPDDSDVRATLGTDGTRAWIVPPDPDPD